jgi:long-chain acyl-CoA synthetase
VRILDEQGQEVPTRELGEICIKGPCVMLGYWNNPTATAEAIRDGWFHTGDVGYVDEEEYLFLVDRTKDMINSAGFKIWPREVEEVLYQHPAIREAAVIGVPDPVRGEIAKGVVALRDGVTVTSAELIAFCRQQLASYKVPAMFEVVDALPRNATGKILKRLIREELEQQSAPR